MARGNQRDVSRAKNLKKDAQQKSGNNQSGNELRMSRESAADIMRLKQAGQFKKDDKKKTPGGDQKKQEKKN